MYVVQLSSAGEGPAPFPVAWSCCCPMLLREPVQLADPAETKSCWEKVDLPALAWCIGAAGLVAEEVLKERGKTPRPKAEPGASPTPCC